MLTTQFPVSPFTHISTRCLSAGIILFVHQLYIPFLLLLPLFLILELSGYVPHYSYFHPSHTYISQGHFSWLLKDIHYLFSTKNKNTAKTSIFAEFGLIQLYLLGGKKHVLVPTVNLTDQQ
jgi:hypothetical protein